MDAYLVEIESKAEDDFIIEKAMSLASGSGDGLDYWMGAQDSDGDGVWNWATSGQFLMCLQNRLIIKDLFISLKFLVMLVIVNTIFTTLSPA